eukprot:190672-Pelagomonas_calceolata.AAC.1
MGAQLILSHLGLGEDREALWQNGLTLGGTDYHQNLQECLLGMLNGPTGIIGKREQILTGGVFRNDAKNGLNPWQCYVVGDQGEAPGDMRQNGGTQMKMLLTKQLSSRGRREGAVAGHGC